MRALIAAAILTVFATAPALGASTIKGDYIGCLTEDTFDEMIRAMNNKDMRQAEALMNRVCFFVQGLEYSVVDRGWTTVRARVYAGGDSVILWLPIEAVAD